MTNDAGSHPPARSDVVKAGTAALAASSIEWFDFYVYLSASALIFGPLFFPKVSPVAAVLGAFSTAAVGFIARPIGSVVFGHFGDRLGRKPTLLIALATMGTSTLLIGLLPPYSVIGAWAPALLFVLRFCQGLAIGGQWGGAVLLATEYAPAHRRGLYGSLAQSGVNVGIVTANLMLLALAAATTEPEFLAWGWRIPFLLNVLFIGVALYLQLRLEDTPAFRRLQRNRETTASRGSPVLEVLREHPAQVLLAGGAFLYSGTAYVLSSGVLDYGTRALALPKSTMLIAVLISTGLAIPALIGFSALSDRLGRTRVYLTGAVLLGLWAFPLFWLVDTGAPLLITVALTVAQVLVAMMYGPQAALFTEMFTARLRYSGASLGYQGAAVVGGLAPIVMVFLLETTGTSLSVSFYLMVMSALTFLSVLLILRRTRSPQADRSAAAEAPPTAPARTENAHG